MKEEELLQKIEEEMAKTENLRFLKRLDIKIQQRKALKDALK
jgi:hypothetical protein